MLKIKDVREKIADSLKDFLSSDNFVYKKSLSEFVSESEDFKYIIHLSFISWNTHISLTVSIYLTSLKVQKVFNGILKEKYNYSIGNELATIFNSRNARDVVQGNLNIIIRDGKSLDEAVETLQYFYEEIATPYFKKYSSLEILDDIINNPPFSHNPAHVGGDFALRCINGLIIATLIKSTRFFDVMAVYDEEIKTTPPEAIEDYETVREYLKYNRVH